MKPQSPNIPAIPEEIRKQIEELKSSNAAYRRAWELAKRFKDNAENKAAKNQWAKDSLESEREMNHILTQEISTLEQTIQDQDKQIIEKGKEIDRLKGLIRDAWWLEHSFDYAKDKDIKAWQQFCKENNIEL